MTHLESQQDTIERFVRHQLSPDERRAFEEHYFECEECFEQVQTMARFVAGIRQAARKGLLTESVTAPWWAILFKPAVIFATATALILIAGMGWLLWKQAPAPQQELASGQTPTPAPQSTATIAALTPPIGESPKPDLLAQNRPPQTPETSPAKSVVVFLDSERGDGGNQLILPANASSAILRIDVDPGNSFSGFQFEIFDSSRKLLTKASSGKASAKGTVSANISTELLQTGKYVVKCFGLRDGQRELVGEYRLQVQKP